MGPCVSRSGAGPGSAVLDTRTFLGPGDTTLSHRGESPAPSGSRGFGEVEAVGTGRTCTFGGAGSPGLGSRVYPGRAVGAGDRARRPLGRCAAVLAGFTGQPGGELRGTGPQQPVIPGRCVWPQSCPEGPAHCGLGWDSPDLWTVLEKLRLPAGMQDGGGGGRVIYTPLALSPELYKQAINQGRAHRPLPGRKVVGRTWGAAWSRGACG